MWLNSTNQIPKAMTITVNHPNGKERKQLRMERTGNNWTNTQWGQWKDDDWTREHRAAEVGMTEDEAKLEQQQWLADMLGMGWTL